MSDTLLHLSINATSEHHFDVIWCIKINAQEAGLSKQKQTKKKGEAGLDINICPIPVKTYVGQVDLVLWLSDGTSEKNGRFSNVPVRRTNLFPLV